MTPGELLRDARRRHGLAQRQLAARAGTSQAAISRLERDLISPSVATLGWLLDLLGEELQLSSQTIDYKFDRDAHDENLALTPAERIDQGAMISNFLLGDLGSETREMAERFRPTLHSEIARVLALNENQWMTTTELAAAVNSAARYSKSDGSPVTDYQIHGRTKNYGDVFERDGTRVRLARVPARP